MVLSEVAITVGEIERASDLDTVRQVVRNFTHPLGYDRFVLYSAAVESDEVINVLYWIEGDWFGTGQQLDPKIYLSRCPITRHILESDAPFFWTKNIRKGQDVYRIVDHPRGFGVHGLQVPVYGMRGLKGAMSFGGSTINYSIEVRLSLTLIAMAAVHAANRINGLHTPASQPQLTPREQEVLQWVASGQKQSDIALLMNLSERTVENHLRRIRKRLGVNTTAQAVMVSAHYGLRNTTDNR